MTYVSGSSKNIWADPTKAWETELLKRIPALCNAAVVEGNVVGDTVVEAATDDGNSIQQKIWTSWFVTIHYYKKQIILA